MNRILFFGFLLFMNALSGCEKKTAIARPVTEGNVVIDSDLYSQTSTKGYMITEASIVGDSLFITFGASGCDPKGWSTKLVSVEGIAKSNPPQRDIRLALTNDQDCLAFFSVKQAFNISNIKVSGYDKLTINLDGYEKPLRYSY
ncbi:MAG: hypothetical protein QM727_06315 [Niabella sp.]